jgi:DNA repair exonuclease SbcCD nuclease subunit
MSRFIFSADWHCHPFRIASLDGGQDRLNDGLSAVRQILTAAQERRCPLVFGGDMKHLKGSWPLSALNGLLELFREFQDVPKLLLPGNHDGVAGGMSGLEAFRELPRVTVVTEPAILAFAGWGDGWERPMAYWPHQSNLDGLPAFLQEAKRAKARVLFAHAFLSGSQVGGSGLVLKEGVTLEQFGLSAPKGKVPIFEYGFFGDVHLRQELGKRSTSSVVWYAGSPYAQNWGETEPDKGCLLVDLDSGMVEPIPIQAPRFIVEDLSGNKGKNAALERELIADWRGHFVRLIVGPWADPALLERVREASGARTFEVIVKRAERATERRADLHAAMSQRELLSKYVAARPPAEGLDRKALLAAGERLLLN